VAILRRRKWVFIVLPLVAGLVAFAISEGGAPSYRAQAVVLLNRANVVSGVTGTQDPAVFDSIRFLETQASIARSPKLATRVAKAAGVPGLTAGGVLGASSVTAEEDSDLLRFSVSAPSTTEAVRIANAYASEFTRFKTDLDTLKVNAALQQIRSRLRTLEARGQADGAAYQTLTEYLNQLLIGRFLLTNSATVLEPAGGAVEAGASPQRSFMTGALLGFVLAVGIAFAAEALDRKVRSVEELEDALALPLLGRVPQPPEKSENEDRLVMLAEPLGVYSETFRRLRTNIEFVNRERKAKTIMFTSALPQEGKSTTIANVAIAFARAGTHVALVDLDVRLPTQHSLFNVRVGHGIAEVVAGYDTADRAIRRIVLPTDTRSGPTDNGRPNPGRSPVAVPSGVAPTGGRRRRNPETEIVLHLLVGGRVPPAHVEFLSSERVGAVLEELGRRFDLVFVDAPPLLAVGDAMALSAKVDAIVAVIQVGIQRPVLREFVRQLGQCRAPRLGFVATGTEHTDGYGYGYEYGARVPHRSETPERTR
jgi:Mrp family chromosome partitioning ATPase